MICFKLTTDTPEEMITLLRGLNLEVTKDEPMRKVQEEATVHDREPEQLQATEGLGETPEKDEFQQGDEVISPRYSEKGFIFGRASLRGSYIVMFPDRVTMLPGAELCKTGRRLYFVEIGKSHTEQGATK